MKKSAMNVLLGVFVALLKMAHTKPGVRFIQYDENNGDFIMAFSDTAGGDVVIFKNWKGKSFVQVVHEVSGHLIDRANFDKEGKSNV